MRGLIMGKFMPLHFGHIEMIKFALKRVNELIILVVLKDAEAIEGDIRVKWLQTYFEGQEKVKIISFHHRLPHDGNFTVANMDRWCEAIAEVVPTIDMIISSESYGGYLAQYLGVDFCVYDQERQSFPISGTDIRKNPEAYFEWLPECVKDYYIKEKKRN